MRSMNADRECFDPAKRSIPDSTSVDSVTDVFSFILLIYYHKFCWIVEESGAIKKPSRKAGLFIPRVLAFDFVFCHHAVADGNHAVSVFGDVVFVGDEHDGVAFSVQAV